MQADTVLQHSRMYGNRDRRDLAVTRFYTSREVYNRLETINTFENTLRAAFENGAHDQGVVFIETDANNKIRPCAPNKVLLSNVVAIKSGGLYLPTGFQTHSGGSMIEAEHKLKTLIPESAFNQHAFAEIDLDTATKIIATIKTTLKFVEDEFDWSAMLGLLAYYAKVKTNENSSKIWLIAETGRQLNREKSGNKSGLSILGAGLRPALNAPRAHPALILLRQDGTKELGWSGHRFWWPILATPTTGMPCVFAANTSA